MDYSVEDIEAAKQLARDLESFTNRDISHVANLPRVTDKSRRMVITELLIIEFGEGILSKGVFNPFGASTLTTDTSYRKDVVSTGQPVSQDQA